MRSLFETGSIADSLIPHIMGSCPSKINTRGRMIA
jgi:hypothetical protein